MKPAQRRIYLELARTVEFPLCAFCRYGSRMETCDDYQWCEHPLEVLGVHELDPGDDCWGFRPGHHVELIAGIVGEMLSHNWASVVWWQGKDGAWKIAGE